MPLPLTRLCWLNNITSGVRLACKARISKGEALGNQHDRASGLNLTVFASFRDTIYLGNAVASFRQTATPPMECISQTRGSVRFSEHGFLISGFSLILLSDLLVMPFF
jgi:hypothetical protein